MPSKKMYALMDKLTAHGWVAQSPNLYHRTYVKIGKYTSWVCNIFWITEDVFYDRVPSRREPIFES